MSTWNLGIGDVSEETRAFKDKLASKDSQIASQRDCIAKQTADYEELKERFNETLHKLSSETERALQLEKNLQQRTEDLRNEQISSENAKSALKASQEKNKATALELRQLETTLERISNMSDEHHTRVLKLEREKSGLEQRIKDMESSMNQPVPATNSTTPGRRTTRPRSSSLSNFKITTLEQDLHDTRSLLAKKESELQAATCKAVKLQDDLLRNENERVATERKWISQIELLKVSSQEMEEELRFLREQQSDGSREEELLKRIEEDDAKISALEQMLRNTGDEDSLKIEIRRLESHLREDEHRIAVAVEVQATLAREKEGILRELGEREQQLRRVEKELQERKARDYSLGQKAAEILEECNDPLMSEDTCLMDMDAIDPEPMPTRSVTQETNADTVVHIERLLSAIERLRGERDNLRRDVQFLESESRFAIEALEAKLSASISTTSNNATLATIDQLRAEMDDMHSQMLLVGGQYQTNIRDKNAEIKRLGLRVQGLAAVIARSTAHPDDNCSHQDNMTGQQNAARFELEALASERDQLVHELQAKIASLEGQLDAARMGEHESRGQLDDAMCEISELNEHLAELESERDSLALQLTNLMTDLQVAQDELSNAETRYTNLQFHQLNTMTSNEATRTLREHIEELENRVMRRTEQIGIHQHDIRRLETNLRLQEERLIEMTSELEMITAQKDAMVEDCADAREARDDALVLVERLEVDIEALEGANAESTTTVTTLIRVIADTVSRARQTIRLTQDENAAMKRDLASAQEQKKVFQAELQEKMTSLIESSQRFEEQQIEFASVQLALSDEQRSVAEFRTQARQLQEEKSSLADQIASLQARSRHFDERAQKADSPAEQVTSPRLESGEGDSVAELELRHADAPDVLRARLMDMESLLKDLQSRYDVAMADHQRAVEDARAQIQDLESRHQTTSTTLAELRETHRKAVVRGEDHARLALEREEKLAQSQVMHEDTLRKCQALELEIKEVSGELERVHQEHESLLANVREESVMVQRELEKKVASLQGRFEEEARLLDISKEEIARLTLRLAEESSKRAEDQSTHDAALDTTTKRACLAEQAVARLQEDFAALQNNFNAVQSQLAASEDEKTSLQQDITTHEAEVQKIKSLNRYLETQIKESEQLVAMLKAEVERLSADLARAEKACKGAEVNLSLQTAQHKRETAEYQRELSALRTRPNVEQALADLEERNNEMEELLRAKCSEIEENDDRVLEMLKEKKKLSSKVESLSRKVQNLQAKLAAAKASANSNLNASDNAHMSPTPAEEPVPLTKVVSPSLTSTAHQTPQSVGSAFFRPRSATASSAPQPSSSITPPSLKRKPSDRIVSGPSQIARPKTPERNRATTPVFKAKTPENRVAPDLDSMSSVVVIGKKRSAPDDFEGCENMPAQAFTADGEDIENKTPRVRRVLNSLQSGFTPLRHQNARPTAPMPSPRRTAPPRSSPFISDMTNTPDVISASTTKQSNKRSWLGKIRGSEKPSASRSLFDRGEAS